LSVKERPSTKLFPEPRPDFFYKLIVNTSSPRKLPPEWLSLATFGQLMPWEEIIIAGLAAGLVHQIVAEK
jgi:hypothetical protein